MMKFTNALLSLTFLGATIVYSEENTETINKINEEAKDAVEAIKEEAKESQEKVEDIKEEAKDKMNELLGKQVGINEGLYGTALPKADIFGIEVGGLWNIGTGKKFDKDGEKQDEWYKSFGYGAGFKIGYAITDALTVGFRMELAMIGEIEPTDLGKSSLKAQQKTLVEQSAQMLADAAIIKGIKAQSPQAAQLSDSEIRKSNDYKNLYAQQFPLAQGALTKAVDDGLKINNASFKAFAKGLGADLSDAEATALVQGMIAQIEPSLYVKEGDVIKDLFDAEKQFDARKAEVGIKDIELGLIYTLISSNKDIKGSLLHVPNFDLGTSATLALPTGSHKDVAYHKITNGSGRTDLELGLTATYKIMRGLHLAVEDKVKFALAGETTRKTEAGTEVKEKAEGLRHKGYVGLAWGLGNMADALRDIKLTGKYKFERDRLYQQKFGNSEWTKYTDENRMSNAEIEASISYNTFNRFFEKQFPVPFEVEGAWVWPITGTNLGNASYWPSITLRSFYAF